MLSGDGGASYTVSQYSVVEDTRLESIESSRPGHNCARLEHLKHIPQIVTCVLHTAYVYRLAAIDLLYERI